MGGNFSLQLVATRLDKMLYKITVFKYKPTIRCQHLSYTITLGRCCCAWCNSGNTQHSPCKQLGDSNRAKEKHWDHFWPIFHKCAVSSPHPAPVITDCLKHTLPHFIPHYGINMKDSWNSPPKESHKNTHMQTTHTVITGHSQCKPKPCCFGFSTIRPFS